MVVWDASSGEQVQAEALQLCCLMAGRGGDAEAGRKLVAQLEAHGAPRVNLGLAWAKLGALAERCHAYTKALHYKEREFLERRWV